MKTRTFIGIIVALACSFQVFCANISSEKLLASVEIDDLLQRKTEKIRTEEPKAIVISDQEHIGESVSKIQVEAFKLDELMVLTELKYQIAKQFQLTDDFRLFFSRPWSEVTLHSPNWRIEMVSYPPQGLRNQFFVSFELWVDEKRLASFQRSLRCELWIEAYVAIQRIDRGTVLHEGLVNIRPVDSLSLYQTPVEVGTNLNDYILSNGIKPGEPLYWRSLKERPLIEKNNLIDVIAQEGMMKITLKAKALENGVKGQVIRVRNLQSYSDIQAEVVGVNKAQVHF